MKDIPLIILGSARQESDSKRFVEAIFQGQAYSCIELHASHIAPYSYAHDYPAEDDFMELIGQLLQHQLIIFATPVYWYAMSGLMKTFFDRFTDLLTIHKDSGRKLRGKQMALLAVGSDDALPDGFTVPFSDTARYLGMEFLGAAYAPRASLDDHNSIRQQSQIFMQKLSLLPNA